MTNSVARPVRIALNAKGRYVVQEADGSVMPFNGDGYKSIPFLSHAVRLGGYNLNIIDRIGAVEFDATLSFGHVHYTTRHNVMDRMGEYEASQVPAPAEIEAEPTPAPAAPVPAMPLPCHLIPTPSGRFAFAGRVPADLAFEASNPDFVTLALQCGPGLAEAVSKREGGTFRKLSWASEADAYAYAAGLGYAVPARPVYHPQTLSALRLYQGAAKARCRRIDDAVADADYASASEFVASEPGARDPVAVTRIRTRDRCGEFLAKARTIRAAMRRGGWQGENGPLELARLQERLWLAREDRRAFLAAAARATPQPVVLVRFQPEAWVNDYAVPVDCEGPDTFDVAPELLAMGQGEACALIYQSDRGELQTSAAAPQWVRDWSGPFSIELLDDDAVRALFGMAPAV